MGDTADKPLSNIRREAFCQHYAGDCWGNAAEAYRRAGYKVGRTPEADSAHASRLVADGSVKARIAALRDAALTAMAVDRLDLLQVRANILHDSKVLPEVRLRAASDIERSLGLATPERMDVRQTLIAQVAHSPAPQLSADAVQRLAEIASEVAAMPLSPAAFARPAAEGGT